ncbi:hypothetical protein DITRI_Ditri10aG0022900 [Diplodiscus trichospermus]
MSRKALKAEAELRAKHLKLLKNRVIDSFVDGSCDDSDHQQNAKREGKAPNLKPSSSRRSPLAKPFLKRHFSIGSKRGGQSSLVDYCNLHITLWLTLMDLVTMDGIWKVCPKAGAPDQFPGQLICPAYDELCSNDAVSMSGQWQCANSCNFNGDCVNGKCHCFLGFHGHDCSKDLALAIAMGVESACQMGSANVKMVILALTALLVMCLFICLIF